MSRVHRFYLAIVGLYLLIFLVGMAVVTVAHTLLDDSTLLTTTGLLISGVGAPGVPLVGMLVWLRRHREPGQPVVQVVHRSRWSRVLGYLFAIGHFVALFGGIWLIFTFIKR